MTRYNIDTCSLLVELTISQWTARKLDKSTTEEVIRGKHAQEKGAVRVNKHLFAGRPELEVIGQCVGEARSYLYDATLPWSDSGIRLLPTSKFMEVNAKLQEFEDKFYTLVDEFVDIYPSLITAQAMALGDMFNRNEYPDVNDISHRFSFNANYMPVPQAGDFRIDIGNEAQAELQSKLAKLADERVDHAISGLREKLVEHLKRMSDRLTVDEIAGEVKPRMFHGSLLEGAHFVCDMARDLNIINDPVIEEARLALKQAINGLDIKDLRKDLPTRHEVKANVDAILNKFSF